ncbi:MAG TPA: protein translocase subunit SecDF [Proteiniclasticum sp.]|uniref:protein translocase subunit SecD n=1 Tax=Proteiniclasticum sp. TaxID=2053595 RepID=UPI000E9EB719|nr:protein translocase subunit SecD [Proteiniclasticum sp.]HBW12890.1 protein translocase subunit SecDF [Proteiniclasticum sp.]
MKRKGSISLFVIILVLLSFLSFTAVEGLTVGGYRFKSFGEVINRGLDLQGGVSVVMEVQAEKLTQEELSSIKTLLDLRVNKIGVSETVSTTEGEKRVRIDIPGVYNSSDIVTNLQTTGELTFKDPEGNVILTGSDVQSASGMLDSNSQPVVSLILNEVGAEKFEKATTEFRGKQISINMDGEQLSNPMVNDVISGGQAVITGMSSVAEAQNLAGIINSGALPYPVKAIEVKTVGASLGAGVMGDVLTASIIGIALIVLFMLIKYRRPGFLASVALGFYVWLLLFVFYAIDATLSLSGIAGFLLTIGMAVDANVLIFERIREELAVTNDIPKAIKSGFSNAMSSIIDSNITTIIAGLVLYYIGSGAVKGFALTLMIGIVISMFSALVITRRLLWMGVSMGFLAKPEHFGVSSNPAPKKKRDFIALAKYWRVISAAIMAIGIFFTATQGLNLGLDFAGGTRLVMEIGQEFDKTEIDEIVKTYDDKAQTQVVDNTQIEVRSQSLSTETIDELVEQIQEKYSLKEDSIITLDEIGASIGRELTEGGVKAVVIAAALMLVYISFRFKKNYGFAAILALVHDIFFLIAIYAVARISVNTPFIAAVLTILGYSINDTIVVFDRVRENKKLHPGLSNKEIINLSLGESFSRSVGTLLTTLFTILSVAIFVPQIRDFALPISIGVMVGGLSTFFVASPFWISLEDRVHKIKK